MKSRTLPLSRRSLSFIIVSLISWSSAGAAPVVTGGPVGTLELLSGVRPVFQVVAVGSGVISYEWRFNGAPIRGNPSASTAALALASAGATEVASFGTRASTDRDL